MIKTSNHLLSSCPRILLHLHKYWEKESPETSESTKIFFLVDSAVNISQYKKIKKDFIKTRSVFNEAYLHWRLTSHPLANNLLQRLQCSCLLIDAFSYPECFSSLWLHPVRQDLDMKQN